MATLNNFANLTYNSGTQAGSAVSNTVSTNLIDAYALSAVKYSNNTSWRPGENITYQIAVTNTGTETLFNVGVSDDLGGTGTPLSYLTDSARVESAGVISSVTPSAVNPLTAVVADILAPNETVVFSYVAKADDTVASNVLQIANTAIVTGRELSATGQLVTADPAATLILPRTEEARVTVTKAVDKSTVTSGDTLTYTFTLENSGSLPATNVVITDAFPAEFTVTGVTSVTGGVTTVYTADQYSVNADNTLTLPVGTASITVPAADDTGNGTTVVTVTGTVTAD